MPSYKLFLLQPTIHFAARVNEAGATYPIDEFGYDGVTTGSAGTVVTGMTLLLGSAAGLDDYGRQRIRNVPSPTDMKVGRSSLGVNDGELRVIDNAHITVLDDFRVWAKLPIPPTYKDSDITASGNVDTPPPICRCGGGFAGTIDPQTGLITVDFDASDSRQWSGPTSMNAVDEYIWQLRDGTATVGTITDAAITATFPAGFRWVELSVTSDDGQQHHRHIPIFARDPDNDVTIAHQIVGERRTLQGYELDIRILEDIDRSDYPDGTLVMLWDDDLQAQSVSRVHMRFVGWEQSHNSSTRVDRTGTLKDATLHCVDVLGRLKTLPGFTQIQQATDPATSWTQTEFPNILYYIQYLLHWHSTAMEVADLLHPAATLQLFEYKILGSDADNLFTQVNRLANAVTPDHYFTCNQKGQMLLVVDPIIQNTSDRTTDIVDTISINDWKQVQFPYERPPRVYMLVECAIESDSGTVGTARAALSPGTAEGQGGQYVKTNERICAGQTQLNVTAGNRYARLNARYGHFLITVPLAVIAHANDPAYLGWVRLTIDTGNAPWRGDVFSNQRGIVREIAVQRDYQRTGIVETATLTWEMETSGPAALTVSVGTYCV